LHVSVYGGRGLGGIECLREEGAKDGKTVGIFILHGGFHVFSIGGLVVVRRGEMGFKSLP